MSRLVFIKDISNYIILLIVIKIQTSWQVKLLNLVIKLLLICHTQ